jgi:hypothetical protein
MTNYESDGQTGCALYPTLTLLHKRKTGVCFATSSTSFRRFRVVQKIPGWVEDFLELNSFISSELSLARLVLFYGIMAEPFLT